MYEGDAVPLAKYEEELHRHARHFVEVCKCKGVRESEGKRQWKRREIQTVLTAVHLLQF